MPKLPCLKFRQVPLTFAGASDAAGNCDDEFLQYTQVFLFGLGHVSA